MGASRSSWSETHWRSVIAVRPCFVPQVPGALHSCVDNLLRKAGRDEWSDRRMLLACTEDQRERRGRRRRLRCGQELILTGLLYRGGTER